MAKANRRVRRQNWRQNLGVGFANFKYGIFWDKEDPETNYGYHNGNYRFYVECTRRKNKTFEVSFGTTSEFSFCPVCGQFSNNDCCDKSEFLTIHESKLFNWLYKNGWLNY